MNNQRTHYVTTTDGVTIGGAVHGDGPPLVFLQGVAGDGDLDWQCVLPHLTDRFTCHLPSMRGRGLSGDHPDLSIPRLAEDVITYVDSIGEPPGLVGWSLGASLALVATAQSAAVDAIVPFEPVMVTVMDEREQAAMGAAVASTGELAAAGDLTGALRAFLRWPFSDSEIAEAEDVGYLAAAGRYVPSLLDFFQQVNDPASPEVDEAAVLGAVAAPVLLLHGSDTKPIFTDSAQYVADHAPNARGHEIPGAGHAAPLTHPGAFAEALVEFFSPARQPA